MLSPELIKRLKVSKDFELFLDHVIAQGEFLDSVSTLGDLSAEDIALEVKARARAIEILDAILAPVVDFREKIEHTDEEIEEAEKKYGLK